jgi:hypothetical protein
VPDTDPKLPDIDEMGTDRAQERLKAEDDRIPELSEPLGMARNRMSSIALIARP